ncbi:MAG TPA: phospholipase D-like domain-containing protein [Gammaproteobacteria bacterium]
MTDYLLILHLIIATGAAGHALLYKRRSRSATAWIGAIFLIPGGALFYYLFGVNRVRRRGQKLDLRYPRAPGRDGEKYHVSSAELSDRFPPAAVIGASLSDYHMVTGNHVEVLHNGQQAYPSMLKAIESAERYIYLCTYIFEIDAIGEAFIQALIGARNRGVSVHVITDGFGELTPLPKASWRLAAGRIDAHQFLPLRLFPPQIYLNLRNHRKLLIVDGRTGFTGGMNISGRHVTDKDGGKRPVIDTQFVFEGPVVSQLADVFRRDWFFICGETLTHDDTITDVSGSHACRTIPDGPNEPMDRLESLLAGLVANATRGIAIMTPYFLPSHELISALRIASLKGVTVEIILPEKSDVPWVDWATRKLLWEILLYGVRVYYRPPPFAHTKVLLIDDEYTLIGSANWDARSLRLNFELCVEIFGRELASKLIANFEETKNVSRAITLEDMDNRSLPARLRDAFCWLGSPYL